MKDKPKVGIVGLGMVGTPLARYLREHRGYQRGRNLFLFDKDPQKKFNDDINLAEIIFIAVPSPRATGGNADISIVESVFSSIRGQKTVVIKSTVPPGTSQRFQKEYPRLKVLFNPEFLTEKNSWQDFIKPDRQIVGFVRPNHLKFAQKVLNILPPAPFISPGKKIKITATEAEIIKYAGNVFLARKVNFANLLAKMAEKLNSNYHNIKIGFGSDHRIGMSQLEVDHGGYRGFGGFCLPKDLDALIDSLDGYDLKDCVELLRADRKFNEGVLKSQGLTLEDVSVHDQEWVKRKTQKLKKNKND